MNVRRGDHVRCSCAPECAKSWEVPGAIVGRLPNGQVSYARAPSPGPCVRGVVQKLRTDEDGEREALVKQDRGEFVFHAPIGYGQWAGRKYAAEVWVRVAMLVLAPSAEKGGKDER